MKMTCQINNRTYSWNSNEFFNLCNPIGGNEASAYGIPNSQKSVYVDGGFVGNVNQGGSCNVNQIQFNPHGNGSHTECVGHISKVPNSINSILKGQLFSALLISIKSNNSITESDLPMSQINGLEPEALIIRTYPNPLEKKHRNWLGTNPTYLSALAMKLISESSIKHLLVDLPSVDKEDDPKLTAHHIFWNYPNDLCSQKTITELIYVQDDAEDGVYLLNLQVAPFENDAAPCKPIIYPLR